MGLYDDIAGKTADEIKSFYSLENTPQFVTDYFAPRGTEILKSRTSDIFDGTGGVYQYELLRFQKDLFQNTRPIGKAVK